MDAENVVDGGIRHRGSLVLEALLNMDITRPDAPRGFVTRLAEENGWTIERAEAADREYRRFLMLAWSTDEMVVPSRDVDAAWHEHLLHTRHYWDATCRDILGKPFHHDPGDGGAGDAAKHAAGYDRTLALYERVFGEPAPADVWPRGCTCERAAAPGAAGEVELAMPAWTVLAACTVVALVVMQGVMGKAVAAILAGATVIAAIARAQNRAATARAERSYAYKARYAHGSDAYVAPRVSTSKPKSSSTGGRGRRDEGTRSDNDATMAAIWASDGGDTAAIVAATSTYCAPTPSHSSYSGGCDTGSSHSSHGHSSCGSSSSSHSSCGSSSSSSSSSCGGSSSSSSCGGSSCGGGGCGGS